MQKAISQDAFSISGGVLYPARQVPSPNFDSRPTDTEIDLLVIHCISLPPGQYSGDSVERFFSNELDKCQHPYFEKIATLKVSAHLFIRRDGEVIQFVNFQDRAWHAGVSCFRERECCNDYSIGIELEGIDTGEFTKAQYRKLAQVTSALLSIYPGLSVENIVGHEDIAPDRKTDPGSGFDWALYRSLLDSGSSA